MVRNRDWQGERGSHPKMPRARYTAITQIVTIISHTSRHPASGISTWINMTVHTSAQTQIVTRD
ncbi:hypothetical protein EMCG_05608 [[Emmonsia] crescens]|uniref:Uncharacterized protein n=1 Tax=[Emmonsia] crescens TaxID=73230 RepID=A0A0G2JC87_9EURO|nr:hypothetical protein EMCG_05608 [Emmonsia crescens UAMH 3008]